MMILSQTSNIRRSFNRIVANRNNGKITNAETRQQLVKLKEQLKEPIKNGELKEVVEKLILALD